MCTVSMVIDRWRDDHPWKYPPVYPRPFNPNDLDIKLPGPTREEFDAMKKELEALKKLIKAAKIYDEETGQPDCETAEKVDLLRKMADYLGVDMNDIL